MEYPFYRKEGNQPPATVNDDYRPSLRHDLFLDNSNAPRVDVTFPSSGLNLSTETEESRPSNDAPPPFAPPYSQTKVDSNSFSDSKQLPYDDFRSRSELDFGPTQTSQTYQDNYMKPNNSFAAPYIEQAPSPLPPKPRTLYSRLFNGNQKFAYFCWTISIIQIGIFIGELIRNAQAMKTPIEIHPTFNPLLGPSSYVL